MRPGLAGLTTRGRGLLVAGAAASGVALIVGQRDLLRVGVLVLALPLVAFAVVVRTRFRLACTRSLDSPRVCVGASTTVRLRLTNLSRLPTGVLLVQDDQPFASAAPPRFVVARLEPGEAREVRHHIRPETRGRYRLAPPRVRIADPFGLAELTRSFPAADSLLVTPAVTPLPAVPLGGDWSGGGDSRARSVAAAGEDDAATRQYRQGDDLRRVHWRSTARYGELMVRREEQPWQNRGALLLDARVSAHGGGHGGGHGGDFWGRPDGDPVAATFEVAVAATASIGVHLARHGFALRLVTDAGPAIDEVGGSGFEETLLESLAVMTPSRGRSLVPAVTALRRGDAAGLVVAILGVLDLRETEELARLRHGGTECIALLLDVASWTALPAHAAGDVRHHHAAATLLRGAGWRVVELRAGQGLANRWRHAAERPGLRDAVRERA